MIFNTARKYRIYPTNEQIQIIERTFGACRYVWNKMVEAINYQYENNLSYTIPNYGDIAVNTEWLMDKSIKLDRHSVSNVKMFFKQSFIQCMKRFKEKKAFRKKDGKPLGFPGFRNRKIDKNSFSNYHCEQTWIDFDNYMLKLPVLGLTSFNKHEKPIPSDWKIKHYTISRKANKYYCSICFEYEDNDPLLNQTPKQLPNAIECYLGLDYKSNGLYMDSNDNLANYPKYYRQSQKRLRILQQRYFRQQKGGKNHEKTRLKIQQLHDHISNQRKDFLHKLSTAITKQYDVICVEDIDMGAMSQMLHLGKSTLDNGFGMFRLMLEYKCLRKPFKALIRVPKQFASTQTCSHCHKRQPYNLSLSDRVYSCQYCGLVLDRDLNAAINIRNYGFNMINGNLF